MKQAGVSWREDPALSEGGYDAPSGQRTIEPGLITDLWFFWDTPQPRLEIQLLTVNGTIACACPRAITKGERLPIHRKFVPTRGKATWYLRVATAEHELHGLAITVEFRDRAGRTRTLPIGVDLSMRPGRVLPVEQSFDVPDELLL